MPLWIALGVIVLLAAAYCVLCVLGGRGDTLRRGSSVNGVDLSDLTRDQAVEFLNQSLDGVTEVDGVSYATIELIPEVEGVSSYTLDLSSALGYDTQSAVDAAFAYDHNGPFYVRGVRYLTGGKAYTILPGVQDEDTVAAAVEASGILTLDTRVETEYQVTEDSLIFDMGSSGLAVDKDALIQTVMEHTAQGNFDAIICPMVETAPDAVDVQAIYDEIYTECADATLNVAEDNSYTIQESVQGVSFDVSDVERQLAAAAEGSTLTIPLTLTDPEIDTATLEECLFRDVLGEYTTNVSGTSARRSNVKLAGEKCSGTILLPGEVFSYNETVGQRTEAAGFQKAGAYLNGETVQELGGGVCQGSSTLYCACLYANLEITLRYNHTYVSSYVPLGMDATVSWGGPDYQFRNNTRFPIKIVSSYSNNRLTFQILGTDENNYTVKITSSTLATISAPVKEVEDDTLEVGKTVVEESGHTGYKVQTYRHVYDSDGNLVYEGDEAYSYYRTSDRVVRVGTKEPEPEIPAEAPAEVPAETPAEPSGETPAETPVQPPAEPEAGTQG